MILNDIFIPYKKAHIPIFLTNLILVNTSDKLTDIVFKILTNKITSPTNSPKLFLSYKNGKLYPC